jgi:hypothetical protein
VRLGRHEQDVVEGQALAGELAVEREQPLDVARPQLDVQREDPLDAASPGTVESPGRKVA